MALFVSWAKNGLSREYVIYKVSKWCFQVNFTIMNFSDLNFEFQNLHEAPLVAQKEFELKLASVIVHQVSTRTFAVAMAIWSKLKNVKIWKSAHQVKFKIVHDLFARSLHDLLHDLIFNEIILIIY